MNLTTRLSSESFGPTTTSVDKPPLSHGKCVETATNPTRCTVIAIDVYRARADDVPAGHVSIEEFIQENEKEKERAAAIEEARRWVADSFYKDEPSSIRSLRLKKGFSQARLAMLASTTQAHIARIENGSTDCQVGTLQRVADALGVDVLVTVKAFLTTREMAAKTNTSTND